MTKKLKTYFNWSSGKDSALAFYYLQQDPNFKIERLITSINKHHDRVSMHGLRTSLLEKQADAIGLPLQLIELPEEPTMEDYNSILKNTVKGLKNEDFTNCGFGDIFLEDLREYREKQLQPFGIKCHFPLWKKDTKTLLNNFLDLGFKTVVICTKSELLGKDFVGRIIDKQFIKDLPENVDPCGENGEFHTFCYDGPIFKKPVQFTLGEKIYREYKNPDNTDDKTGMGFWFIDLLPIKD